MSVKYTLSTRAPFFADWRKSTHETLAAALCVAWRKYNREWSVDGITNGRKVVVSSEGLMRAFTRMDDLKREAPQRPLGQVSEQVIREMEIHDDAQERAGAPEGSDDEMSRRSVSRRSPRWSGVSSAPKIESQNNRAVSGGGRSEHRQRRQLHGDG